MRFSVNPLEDWENDDLLLTSGGRARLAQLYERIVPVLAWDELRTEFLKHEKLANEARRQSQGFGLQAVGLGAAGLILMSLTAMLIEAPPTLIIVTRVAAEAFLIGGTILGCYHLLNARSKTLWLASRYATERLRQFYFQLILNHLAEAVAAIDDKAALASWERLRERELKSFLMVHLHDPATRIERMLEDRAELAVWISEAWAAQPSLPRESAKLRELLEALRYQRLGVQLDYTQKKMRPSIASPVWRSQASRTCFHMLTVVVLAMGLLTGGFLIAGHTLTHSAVRVFLGVSAVASACIVVLRVLDEGLQLRVDADRYTWYLAVVSALDSKFASGTTAQRVEALRELERASYQELRRFVHAHRSAKFIL